MSSIIKFPRKPVTTPLATGSIVERIKARRIELDQLPPEAIEIAKTGVHMTIQAQVTAAREQFADDAWVRAVLTEILETIPS